MTVLFRCGYDCARSGNLEITITETGGGGATGTATIAGRYMPDLDLSTINQIDDQGVAVSYALGYASAATAMAAALNAIATAVMTVTFSTTTRKWTIAGDNSGGVTKFQILFNAAAARYFGFSVGGSGVSSYEGDRTAYYVIDGTIGGVRLVKPHEVSDGLAEDLIAADGNVEGLASAGAVQQFEVTFPAEPAARVWHASRVTADPYTWELAFRHLRNVEPFHVIDNASGGFAYVGKLRADACSFEPELLADQYFAYANIALRAHYIGTP